MTEINKLFYVVVRDKAYKAYYLKADKNTASRDYYFPKRISGQEPLIFRSSTEEKDNKKNITRKLSNILMDGLGMIIDEPTKKILANVVIDGMQYYPAVFIDNHECWHEGYWYLNFFDNIDCWDRHKSILEEDEDDEVLKYSLDESILDESLVKVRKMFRMAGATMDYIFIHEELVDMLMSAGITGVKFFKVSDFEEGDQY